MTVPPPSAGFWQRRVRSPLIALLAQGLTPDRVALTLAVGSVCSMFPFLGATTALNLIAGAWLRLNQPLLQALNYLLAPVHLVMIVVYVKAGEWIWRVQDGRFTVAEMLRVFHEQSFVEFLQRFGRAGIHAFSAWVLTAPLLAAVVYLGMRPALRRLASKTGARP